MSDTTISVQRRDAPRIGRVKTVVQQFDEAAFIGFTSGCRRRWGDETLEMKQRAVNM